MHRPVHYRRFHYLHADVLAIIAISTAGWFLWPSAPPPTQTPVRDIVVAYGWIDPHAVGSILYPGHFAFSSPIGFGSMQDVLHAGDPRRSLAGVEPYLAPPPPPPFPRSLPGQGTPLAAAEPVPLPTPSYLRTFTDALSTSRVAPGPLFRTEPSLQLKGRNFHAPRLQDSVLSSAASSGDILAYLQITPRGGVVNVVFAPNILPWSVLRPIEDALLRGVASPSDEASSGWLHLYWHIPASANPSQLNPSQPNPPADSVP